MFTLHRKCSGLELGLIVRFNSATTKSDFKIAYEYIHRVKYGRPCLTNVIGRTRNLCNKQQHVLTAD